MGAKAVVTAAATTRGRAVAALRIAAATRAVLHHHVMLALRIVVVTTPIAVEVVGALRMDPKRDHMDLRVIHQRSREGEARTAAVAEGTDAESFFEMACARCSQTLFVSWQ